MTLCSSYRVCWGSCFLGWAGSNQFIYFLSQNDSFRCPPWLGYWVTLANEQSLANVTYLAVSLSKLCVPMGHRFL